MASERPGSSDCLADQASTFSRISDESRMAVTGSWPVAGRPLCFRTTCFLELFIIFVLRSLGLLFHCACKEGWHTQAELELNSLGNPSPIAPTRPGRRHFGWRVADIRRETFA